MRRSPRTRSSQSTAGSIRLLYPHGFRRFSSQKSLAQVIDELLVVRKALIAGKCIKPLSRLSDGSPAEELGGLARRPLFVAPCVVRIKRESAAYHASCLRFQLSVIFS